ncbi:MAG: UpxY family transcription antiterminator [Chitinophagaceae bacterium]|nr:UpxY family transcription antiterminator [Chitinophagaceae bacterium]
MSIKEKKWYVVYTKPRWEKKVYNLLVEKGIEGYCPLNRTRKKWSDRVKWIEEPLFKSYVFVLVAEEDQTAVRMINGVVNFVYWLGKPAVVKREEIETIRKFLHDYRDVEAVPFDLRENTQVTILQGAFMDKKGVVRKIINNKVQVIIGCIGYSLVAVVDKSNLMMVEK